MVIPTSEPPRRRRNRPSGRALEILRRARETAAAAAQAAAEAAELIARSRGRRRRRRPPFEARRDASQPSTMTQRPNSTSVDMGPPTGPNYRKMEDSNKEPNTDGVKKRRPPGYWARRRKYRKERRAAEAAAAEAAESSEFYYGPQGMQMDPFAYPPEFYPDEYPPPPEPEVYGWSGNRGGFPPQFGPSFEVYPGDRMQSPMNPRTDRARNNEYLAQARALIRSQNGRMSGEPRAPHGARRYSSPLVPPEPWGPPTRPYDARW